MSRQAHPKKTTKFKFMRHGEVTFVQDMINGRRRKSLVRKRPNDFLRELAKLAAAAVASDAFFDPWPGSFAYSAPALGLAFRQKLHPKTLDQPSTPDCVMKVAFDGRLRNPFLFISPGVIGINSSLSLILKSHEPTIRGSANW
jgi:hypothetical protein